MIIDFSNLTISEECISYYGGNHYHIYDKGRVCELVIHELDDTCENKIKTTRSCYSCLSTAIQAIEQMESGIII